MKKQLFYFLIVGSIGFIIDAGGVFLLSHMLDFSPILIRIPPFICAIFVTFYLNWKYTFSTASGAEHIGLAKAVVKYMSANAASQGLNFAIYTGLVMGFSIFYNAPYLAVTLGSLSVMFLSFALSKYWIFKA